MGGGVALVLCCGSRQVQVRERGGGRRDVAQVTGQSLLQDHVCIPGKESAIPCGGELEAGPVVGRARLREA